MRRLSPGYLCATAPSLCEVVRVLVQMRGISDRITSYYNLVCLCVRIITPVHIRKANCQARCQAARRSKDWHTAKAHLYNMTRVQLVKTACNCMPTVLHVDTRVYACSEPATQTILWSQPSRDLPGSAEPQNHKDLSSVDPQSGGS